MQKLIKLIGSLSEEEQTRLQESLMPVLKARKAMTDFHRIQIPKDLAELKKINDQRILVIAKDDKVELAKLDEKLESIREKIAGVAEDGWVKSGHEYNKINLAKMFKKAKESFGAHY